MKVKVCTGAKCTFYGASNILDGLMDMQENLHKFPHIPEDVELIVEAIPCLNYCKRDEDRLKPPVVLVNGEVVAKAKSNQIMEIVLQNLQVKEDEE